MPETSTMPAPRKTKRSEKKLAMRTVGVRASESWIEWLEEVAAYDQRTVAALFDRAVTKYAESLGFPKPPPPR